MPFLSIPIPFLVGRLPELPIQRLVLQLQMLVLSVEQNELIFKFFVELQLPQQLIMGLDQLLLQERGLGVDAPVQRVDVSALNLTLPVI